jgi:Transposase DNA-binding
MSGSQDARAWAEAEFRGVPRLEQRLQDRLVETVTRLAQRPTGTLPQRLDWAELKGCYRLLDDDRVTPDTVQAVHRAATRDRMHRDTPVLIVHDGTEHDFSTHAVAEQLEPIGNGSRRGLLQHNSLALDPTTGERLGLVHQHTFVREPVPADETRAQRAARGRRESAVWARGIRAVGPMPAGRCWVHVADRGADVFEAMATVRLTGGHFLFRLCQDRRVRSLDGSADGYLMQWARALPAEATDEVTVAGKGGRPGRVARVCLAHARVRVRPSTQDRKWRGHAPLVVTVIRVWEPDPPAGVEFPTKSGQRLAVVLVVRPLELVWGNVPP